MVRKLLRSRGRCYVRVKHRKGTKPRYGNKLVKCPKKKATRRRAAPKRKSTKRKARRGCAKRVSRAVKTIKNCGCR